MANGRRMTTAAGAANEIDPRAHIGSKVVLGKGNRIAAFAYIDGDVVIGDANWIGPHVTIGTPAQYTTSKFELNGEQHGGIRIGSRCVIREYCTVHQPSKFKTIVEDDCYFMAYCHVSHDTVIRRGVAMANNTQIGGFTEIRARRNNGLLGRFIIVNDVAPGALPVRHELPFSQKVSQTL